MKKSARYILPLTFAMMALCPSVASSSPVKVKASLDSVQILMGRMTALRLQVVEDEGVRGTFPILNPNELGVAGVCGDSVELRTSVQRDTTRLGSGRIQVDWTVPVQAFDSGLYRLPEMVYVAGRDTARSNSVTLKVIPVQAKADDPIADYALPADPAGKSFWDFLPDWLVDYGWIILAVIMLAGIVWMEAFGRRKAPAGVKLKAAPIIDPNVEAEQKLRELKERKLWEQGQEKEYFTILTDILRRYLQRRFGINAMEMTSRQIMQTLASDDTLRDKRSGVRQILDMADFVKFAKVRPLPDDNVAAWNNAMNFVTSTRPVVVAGTPDVETKKGGES